MADLTGKWKGTVIYGNGYRQLTGKELFFEFDLVQRGEEVTGTGIDTGGTGTSPDLADIRGQFKDNALTFIKQYRSSHHVLGGETKVNPKRRGPKIEYSATYHPQDDSFSGEWVIKLTFLLLWSIQIPLPIRIGGTWTMRRK